MKRSPRSFFGNLFPKLRAQTSAPAGRPFSVVQVEITSRCSTGCKFCPHDALSDRWVEGDLPLELFHEHIAPHLNLFDLVYLQGWGEPMLHPGLWEMLGSAQEKGCRTGFTTNGAWLEDEQNHLLVDRAIDMISVSFAGQKAPMHEALRTNSEFNKLRRNFENLARLKRQRGAGKPWLELHFLMNRVNLAELPALVEVAASLGADEVVATNLTYSPSPALDDMHVFADQPLENDLEIVDRAKKAAERLGLPLRVYPLLTEPHTLVCDADPIQTIYINHCGEVAPCVYLGLTVTGQIPRYYQGEAQPFHPLSFGNVARGLVDVLEGKERGEFTHAFKQRRSSSPVALFAIMAGQGGSAELPPPPPPCKHCYKLLGV